tara:strand:- start:8140 stop:8700 length:561 start_codon:yes stop_codon:yes gene_type:complete
MKKKVFLVIFFLTVLIFLYSKITHKKEPNEILSKKEEQTVYDSNVIDNVNYTSKDGKGNEYIINALRGEIDFSDSSIIYLTNVKALIKLNNYDNITITSNYGKYNTDNYDTIFSENVIVNYLDNEIKGGYLDFSMQRNSMIISKNVVYTNLENILKADVVDINIQTKDTKIFMHENKKKVKIKSKN